MNLSTFNIHLCVCVCVCVCFIVKLIEFRMIKLDKKKEQAFNQSIVVSLVVNKSKQKANVYRTCFFLFCKLKLNTHTHTKKNILVLC